MAAQQTRRLPRCASCSAPYKFQNWPVYLVNELKYFLAALESVIQICVSAD